MAIDLTAKLSLQDDFTKKMERVERRMKSAEKTTSSLSKATSSYNGYLDRSSRSADRFNAGMRKIGSGAKKAISGITSLKGSFIGLTAAVGGAMAAKQAFDSTVWEAAKMEQSQVVLNALFDDEKAAKQYEKMIKQFSLDSPMLDLSDMYNTSSSYLTISKDVKQLEKLYDITERLIAANPQRTLEDASFSLREMLMSGDAISLIDRFNLSRDAMNRIKELDLPQQITELDKYLNKIGFTSKLVDDISSTTIAKFNKVKEQFKLFLTEMGQPSLDVLSGFFDRLTSKFDSGQFQNMAKMGGRMIEGILSGLTSGINRVYDWFLAISNNPDFQARTTLTGKIDFIFNDLYERFTAWYEGGGKDKLEAAVTKMIEFSASTIVNSWDLVAPAANALGTSIANGVIDGFKNRIASFSFADFIQGTPMPVEPNYGGSGKKNSSGHEFIGPKPPGFSGGLSRVPYNGFQATLHKDEQVLTAEEAKEYRNGGGNGVTIAKLADHIIVREEADIEKFAYRLAKLIEREGNQMGRVY
ncbi:hypothetical protein [Bacillus seohaeanensis]|uniref:Phage tail tape measure protein n=1 Tax=Bacillus seohaeanensis TaxID=284580 RepID=A0ABW5RS22_9BACI